MYLGQENFFLNRPLCDVLEDMRKITKSHNINMDLLRSLVEEAQVFANRMESSLEDVRDLEHLHSRRKELSDEIQELAKCLESKD